MRLYSIYNGLWCRVLSVGAALLAVSCIENDIPYPIVECRIESIEVEGAAGEPVIDYVERRVTLTLLETTDIQNVVIKSAVLTDGAEASPAIVGTHDMRGPLRTTLSLYQEYGWEIVAEQTIPRSFTVEGQVGATVWNFSDRTAYAYVGFDDLSDVRIKSLKLGPAGITRMSCVDVGEFTETSDFNSEKFRRLRDFSESPYHQVFVNCHGRTENWVLYVAHTDATVAFTRIDGWVRTAWFYAEGLSGAELGFRYRRTVDEEWTTVPAGEIKIDGGAFSARVRGLEPECEYEAVACSGADESAVMTFTTQPELPLPNSGFEEWATLSDKILHPYLTAEDAFWDTGNKGASAAGEILTESSTDKRPGSPGQYSAALTSKFANIAGIGKFAAGNIFVGTYAKTVGTNGLVDFGRPFTSRPVALRGWVKFQNGKIDQIKNQPSGKTLTTDDVDEGSIYIAMGTWTKEEYGGSESDSPRSDASPVRVDTRDEKTFFNKNSKDVVAYGERIFTEPTDGWVQFEIPLDYRSTDIVPTHLIIVCSASRWGDYFAGSTQNRMWLDDFELVWE